jgi:hypothetical protein
MRGIFAIAAAVVGFGAIAALAADPNGRAVTDQPAPLTTPPLSGTTSSDLARSGGVITPPADVDPQIKRMPPQCPSQPTRCRSFRHRAPPAATNGSNQSSGVARISTTSG